MGRRRIGSQFDRGVEDDAVTTGQRRNDGHRFEEIRQGHSRSRRGDARLGRVDFDFLYPLFSIPPIFYFVSSVDLLDILSK